MKFNIIINSIIVCVAAVFLIVLGFRVNAGATIDSIAILKTNGMTCRSCSIKITTALEGVNGVAITDVNVEEGWVAVGYDAKSVTPDVLARKVTDIGFASNVKLIMTPEQFKQSTGRYLGNKAESGSGCCGSKNGGCGAGKQDEPHGRSI